MVTHTLKTNVQEWICAISLFLISGPYFVWNNGLSLLAQFVVLALFVFSPLFSKNWLTLQKNTFFPFLLLLCFYLLAAIRHSGNESGALYYAIFPIIFLSNPTILNGSYEKFIKLLAVLLIPSILFYLLITFSHINLSYNLITPLNAFKPGLYKQYPFLVMDDTGTSLFISRFCGLFDEPGVIGSLAGLILLVKNYNLKNPYLIPIFVAGILSFSFYFYCVSAFFLIMNIKSKSIRFSIFIIAIAIFYLYQINDLQLLIFNRFTIEDGRVVGDSRTSLYFATWFSNFRFSKEYFLGLGSGSNLILNNGGASYKDIIVNYGIIMFIMYIMAYIVLAFRYRNNLKHFILTSFVIISFIYQRPFITDMFLAISFLYCIYHKSVVITCRCYNQK